ncbi:hypothetical protein JK635_07435 [Neobacillus sp. YIM B02564]|uniref:Uncharacterized protein n=1 Tax=Neobacillus paridis TaxID=2803862 RepID=A0ABS1TL47_9BACI|nr:hypothetical protein [Neobacillus paridis]MBL4952041.1 hypothetical protein [Neobacillus paridis]
MNPDRWKTEKFDPIAGDYELVTPYVKSTFPIEIRHKPCGTIYPTLPKNFLKGAGRCPVCCLWEKYDLPIPVFHPLSLQADKPTLSPLTPPDNPYKRMSILTKTNDPNDSRRLQDIHIEKEIQDLHLFEGAKKESVFRNVFSRLKEAVRKTFTKHNKE